MEQCLDSGILDHPDIHPWKLSAQAQTWAFCYIWSLASNAGRLCVSGLFAPPHTTLPTFLCPPLPSGGCTTTSAREPTVEAEFVCLSSFHTPATRLTFKLTFKTLSPFPALSAIPTHPLPYPGPHCAHQEWSPSLFPRNALGWRDGSVLAALPEDRS